MAAIYAAAPLPGMLDILKNCETFQCLRSAHAQPRGAARFNFPHFFIIGYAKAATTSLHA